MYLIKVQTKSLDILSNNLKVLEPLSLLSFNTFIVKHTTKQKSTLQRYIVLAYDNNEYSIYIYFLLIFQRGPSEFRIPSYN